MSLLNARPRMGRREFYTAELALLRDLASVGGSAQVSSLLRGLRRGRTLGALIDRGLIELIGGSADLTPRGRRLAGLPVAL